MKSAHFMQKEKLLADNYLVANVTVTEKQVSEEEKLRICKVSFCHSSSEYILHSLLHRVYNEIKWQGNWMSVYNRHSRNIIDAFL